jgi:hypothetical protein
MYIILLLLLFEPILRYMITTINIKIYYRLFILSLFISIQIHGNFQLLALFGWFSTFILVYDYLNGADNNQLADDII